MMKANIHNFLFFVNFTLASYQLLIAISSWLSACQHIPLPLPLPLSLLLFHPPPPPPPPPDVSDNGGKATTECEVAVGDFLVAQSLAIKVQEEEMSGKFNKLETPFMTVSEVRRKLYKEGLIEGGAGKGRG